MRLTPLTEADLEQILPWRNAPAVRRVMYSHHAISLDEHRAWLSICFSLMSWLQNSPGEIQR